MVATALVPLPTSRSKAVKLPAPVPPLATGRTPVTLAVRSMVLLVISELVIREEERRPEELLWTTPAEEKAVTTGAWAMVRLVTVVVANVEVAVAVKLVAVVVAKVVTPLTVRRLEIVVEPVTAKVLELELKVKLLEVAKVLLPWPKRMSLAVRFCSWMVGVRPPEETTEPAPETDVT